MPNPELLMLSPDDLVPNPWNPNVMSPENEAKLDESIKRFGLFRPIVARETDDGLEILGGQHRWEGAKRLGITSIPVANVGRIDDAKAKEIGLADNARYGFDDGALLHDILKDLGDSDEIQSFLPYSDADIRSIFSNADIALGELDLEDTFDKTEELHEPPTAKAPKTHQVMRFKISIGDSERITELITKTSKRHGFTNADDLTNAGDALVHLLLSGGEASDPE